jgi:hypothetical protein
VSVFILPLAVLSALAPPLINTLTLVFQFLHVYFQRFWILFLFFFFFYTISSFTFSTSLTTPVTRFTPLCSLIPPVSLKWFLLFLIIYYVVSITHLLLSPHPYFTLILTSPIHSQILLCIKYYLECSEIETFSVFCCVLLSIYKCNWADYFTVSYINFACKLLSC